MTEIYEKNFKLNSKEINNSAIELKAMPRRLNIALTTICNIDCIMCVVKDRPWEIPAERIDEIASIFPYLESVIWQGGEVFLYKNFESVLEKASVYPDLRHEITTNAHLLTEKWMKIFENIPLDINISVDATTKEVYDYIRKGSHFEDILSILEKLNRHKKTGARVMILTVMRSNYKQINDFPKFAKKYGFDRVIIQPVKSNIENDENIFDGKNDEILNEIKSMMNDVRSELERLKIDLVDILPLPGDDNDENLNDEQSDDENNKENEEKKVLFKCYAPWQQMFVEWGGDVFPHCLCICDGPNDIRVAGNVKEMSLMDIWNSEKMKEYRERLAVGKAEGLCNPACLSGLISEDMRNLHIKDDE